MMVIEQKALGRRVRSLRTKKQLTQEQLAEIMNISVGHLRGIESGRKCGSIDLICDFSGFFGVSIDYILKGENNTDNKPIKQELQNAIEKLSELITRL